MDDQCFKFENGLYVTGSMQEYSLCFKNQVLQPFLSKYSFVEHEFLAVKARSKVVVYSLRSIDKTPTIIGEFDVFCSPSYLTLKINNKTYIIDFNSDITCH